MRPIHPHSYSLSYLTAVDVYRVPETFGIVATGAVQQRARANLREVANLIDQVTLGQEFEIGSKMEPLNAYVQDDGAKFRKWLIEGTSTPLVCTAQQTT